MNLSHLHFYLEDRFFRKLLAIFPKNAISLFEALTTLLYLAFLTSFFENWWNFAGLQGGLVTIFARPGSSSYKSVTSNGITSQASGHAKRSFNFKSKFSLICF